ncbi:MAG: RHS repeat-associated core domain-containing protein, partial [Anaerolineaceae bacterium]|nr:RHS repeat-associated core domain-containing protein [Anaerolineaceae bacterium]
AYNGLGDRVSETTNGVTTSFTLDLNAGLTQALSDGTNTYLYGNRRIGQFTGEESAYFLGDALGSVRQLVDGSGNITLTKSYEPYGKGLTSVGSGSSMYGFASEQTDFSGLIYLRARYYSTYLNQFIQPDPILPDPRVPGNWNRYVYSRNNPINLTDPSGKTPCLYKDDMAACYSKLITLNYFASSVKQYVRSGALPVEGFANFVDYAYLLFDQDIRGTMWGVTQVISGFDPNNPLDPIWNQARRNAPHGPSFIGEDWLPYQNKPDYNDTNWGGTGLTWVHSRIGDWREEYWDKTANQAYHFWFYASSTFFDVGGLFWANLGNFIHDVPFKHMAYDYVHSPENEAPPMLDGQQAPSQPDYLLAWAGINYGSKLLKDYEWSLILDPCKNNHNLPSTINPGDWIRQNLKE